MTPLETLVTALFAVATWWLPFRFAYRAWKDTRPDPKRRIPRVDLRAHELGLLTVEDKPKGIHLAWTLDGAEGAREALQRAYSGPANTGRLMVLPEAVTFTPLPPLPPSGLKESPCPKESPK